MGVKVIFLREETASATRVCRHRVCDAVVPKAAVRTENASRTSCSVVKGIVVERRAVKIGSADGDRLEVVAGLQSGEQVVSPLPADLQDGNSRHGEVIRDRRSIASARIVDA